MCLLSCLFSCLQCRTMVERDARYALPFGELLPLVYCKACLLSSSLGSCFILPLPGDRRSHSFQYPTPNASPPLIATTLLNPFPHLLYPFPHLLSTLTQKSFTNHINAFSTLHGLLGFNTLKSYLLTNSATTLFICIIASFFPTHSNWP